MIAKKHVDMEHSFHEGAIDFKMHVRDVKSVVLNKDTKAINSGIPSVFGDLKGLPDGKYVWGYANIPTPDSEGDLVERQAIEKGMQTLTTKPYNKIFIVHDYQDIAVGKIIKTAMDDTGPLIMGVLNEDHKRCDEAWKSIQNGYLDSFSIGGSFIKVVTEWSETFERYINVVKELVLREVSLTSIPTHPGASVMGAFSKVLSYHKKQLEENKMSEDETKNQNPPAAGEDQNNQPAQEDKKNENSEAQKSAPEGDEKKPEGEDKKANENKDEPETVEKRLEKVENSVSEIKDAVKSILSVVKPEGEGKQEAHKSGKPADKKSQISANNKFEKNNDAQKSTKSSGFMEWLAQ